MGVKMGYFNISVTEIQNDKISLIDYFKFKFINCF